jgi:DeoR family transcriptional regulator, suf operon transcriptional repressor
MESPIVPHPQRSSDHALIELLRVRESLGIGALAEALGVTATAVRQRLDRLTQAGLVGRSIATNQGHVRHRGRPSHVYSLTEKGRRSGGDNFRDLAMVLWTEVRSVKEPSVRQGLLSRIAAAMAGLYREDVSGSTARQRLESVATLFRNRNLSCDVGPSADEASPGLPVLTTYSCPYPELAEQDRGICAAERLMLQELVGASVQLSECRLDGASCCRFTAGDATPAG